MAYDVVLQARGKVQAALRLCLVVATLAAAATAPAAAQPAERELLNSERIAATFGNYGIEVLSQDRALRVSSLYSTDEGARTCRTFAIVRYPSNVDRLVAREHAAVVAGGSIGAVFAERGWEVRKTHLAYTEVAASPRLAGIMRIAPGTSLAEHLYVLDVAKDGRVVEYAALVEIHHPDYLRSADLERIYGPAGAAQRTALVTDLLAVATERTR